MSDRLTSILALALTLVLGSTSWPGDSADRGACVASEPTPAVVALAAESGANVLIVQIEPARPGDRQGLPAERFDEFYAGDDDDDDDDDDHEVPLDPGGGPRVPRPGRDDGQFRVIRPHGSATLVRHGVPRSPPVAH